MKESNLDKNSCTLSLAVAQCFEKLTDEELLLLEENHTFVEYKKGEILCKQGTKANAILFLCCGLVKVYMESPAGSLILKILPPGNLLGLTTLLESSSFYHYSVYAYNDCKIKIIDLDVFKRIILQNSAFAKEVINLLCENMIQLQTRFFAYTTKQSFGRMADTLLCLTCNIFKTEEFELHLSRKELAELTGLTPESVIRILSKFKTEKLISIDGKKFVILNRDKLQQISDYG